MSYQDQMFTIISRYLYYIISLQAEALSSVARETLRDGAERATHLDALTWARQSQVISESEYRQLWGAAYAHDMLYRSIFQLAQPVSVKG